MSDLSSPFSFLFGADETGAPQTGINAGSFNDDAEEIIRKHLSPGFQQFETGWSALIAGLSAGDAPNFENAALAFDQLYKSSATGLYLDRRSADDGIIRPDNVGIGDDIFRRLSIKTTTKKVVTQALLEILEVYYGTDSTRAHLTTDAAEPYDLEDGWTLLVSVDGDSTVTIPFSADDFSSVGAARAIEVAAVITRWFKANGSTAYALESIDPDSGLKKPVIYSGSLGLQSSVQVLGGEAQNILQFPTFLTQAQVADVWAVSHPAPGVARYKLTGVSTTDLSLVHVGDYVNVFGNGFDDDNRGTFTVTAVDVRYVGATLEQFFEIDNDAVVVQASVAIMASTDIVAFRPTRTTINDNGSRAVVVAQTRPREIDIQLPATTVAVTRTAKSAAYAVIRDAISVSSMVRHGDGVVTVETSSPHGLAEGNQIFIDGVISSGSAPATDAGNGTSTTDASLVTIWAPLAAPSGNAVQNAEAVELLTGAAFFAGGLTVVPAAATDTRTFTVTTTTTLPTGEVRYTYAWAARAAIPVARYGHRMTVLDDSLEAGNVLLTGGRDTAGTPFATAYLYNVAGNSWSSAMTMAVARADHAQVLLTDSRVLLIGGRSPIGGTQTATTELFASSGASGTFAATGSMATARYKAVAFVLASGKVVVAGGYTAAGDTVPIDTCETWDPGTGLWTPAARMTYRRGGAAVVALGDDQFLVTGGTGKVGTNPGSDAALASAEIYDGRTGRWYPAGSMTQARADVRALSAVNGRVVVVGAGTADYFDVATRTWIGVRATPDGARLRAAVTQVVGQTLVFGGTNNGGSTILGTAQLLVRASDEIAAGGLQDVIAVGTVIDSTEFQFSTAERLSYTGVEVDDIAITPFTALAASTDTPGPYLLDPDSGFAITGTETALTVEIEAGSQYQTLKVTTSTALDFPDTQGWLVIGLGTGVEIGPVRYLGRTNADELTLDYDQDFPTDLPVGTTITLLAQKGPFNPDRAQDLGVFYLTDSSSGRVAASASIDSVTAAGIDIFETIVYPGDRGLGGEGLPTHGAVKLSDRVGIWAGNDIDTEIQTAREEE